MQAQFQTNKNAVVPTVTARESLYRTQWLMAHNRLYDLAHDPSASVNDSWAEYLEELQSAESVAKTPA
jgi:hypothetical protein